MKEARKGGRKGGRKEGRKEEGSNEQRNRRKLKRKDGWSQNYMVGENEIERWEVEWLLAPKRVMNTR